MVSLKLTQSYLYNSYQRTAMNVESIESKLKFVMWSSSGLISICRNQFEETFDVYLQAKNKLHPSCFP